MPTVIKPLTKEEAEAIVEGGKVASRMPPEVWQRFEAQGWRIVEDYSIEKVHKGIYIVVEFCIGDFCVYSCSKNNHWLLQPKRPCDTFIEAMVEAQGIEMAIDRGVHWPGEDD